MIWSWRNNKKAYNLKDTAANLGVFAGYQLTKVLLFGLQYSLLSFISTYAIFHFEHSATVFILTFIVVDFVYYWYHRFSHKVKFLWAFHLIHHSSIFFNLTVAYRLNWLNSLLSPFILVPLVLLGFPFEYILLGFALNLVYQFFLHTEAVRKLGWLEGILATPSAHRVHHGSNDEYIDKNFGGILMVWDRIFGTYEPENEKAIYGTTDGFISNNPLVLNFKGFVDYFKGRMHSKG